MAPAQRIPPRAPSVASLAGRALLTGGLLWLAWPPMPFAFLLFVAFVPWLQGVDAILASREGAGAVRAAWLFSYATFLVWNALTTWWVSLATLGGGLFAIVINSLVMTLPVLVYLLARRRLGGVASGVALAAAWIGFEYAHMRWELTWPWLTLGNGFAGHSAWVQWYSVTGVLGGTLWIWIVNGLVYRELGRVAEYAIGLERRYRSTPAQRRRLSLALAAARPLLAVALPLVLSLVWYARVDPEAGRPVRVALLQTDFDPHTEKFDLRPEVIRDRMIALSEPWVDDSLDYLVWPETALTNLIALDDLERDPSLARVGALREAHPGLKIVLGINGQRRFDRAEDAFPSAFRLDRANGTSVWLGHYNSAVQLGPGPRTPYYNKGILVPGPECFPYYEQLRFIEGVLPDVADYMGRLGRSPERVTFLANGETRRGTAAQSLPEAEAAGTEADAPVGVAPAICYESIFGEYMTGWANHGAQLFFVITNDGWWGSSPGRLQHLDYARLRAIECRRAVARSANTGVSCFINQRGDVVRAAGVGEETVLVGTMHANDAVTPYMRHGDLLGRTALWITAGLLLLVLSSWLTGGFLLSRPDAPRAGLRPKAFRG